MILLKYVIANLNLKGSGIGIAANSVSHAMTQRARLTLFAGMPVVQVFLYTL